MILMVVIRSFLDTSCTTFYNNFSYIRTVCRQTYFSPQTISAFPMTKLLTKLSTFHRDNEVKQETLILTSRTNTQVENADKLSSITQRCDQRNDPATELEVAKFLCSMNCTIPSSNEGKDHHHNLDKPAPGWNAADGAFQRICMDSIVDVTIADTHGTEGTKLWRQMVREQPGSRYFTADQAKDKFAAILRQRYPGVSVRFWCKLRSKHGNVPEAWNTLPKDKRGRIVNKRKRPPYLGYYKEADDKEIVTNLVTRRERKPRT